jgi:cytochrome c biogenesis protein CcmG, thiol:disulfide interchange protein DsbE
VSLGLLLALALGASACGGNGSGDDARLRELARPVADPARLSDLGSEVLGGGQDAFDRQLGALRGHPIVVNKWASWCGPCRAEFPIFARAAETMEDEVAFLGVDSLDNLDDATEFLDERPLPYPSFFDPEGKLARSFRGERVAPVTAFYDRDGELTYTKQGPYTSQQALLDDVERYAGAR